MFENLSPQDVLQLFLILKLIQHVVESSLSRMNALFWSDASRQKEAAKELGITDEDMRKSYEYSIAKFRFGRGRSTILFLAFMAFIAFKGIAVLDSFSQSMAAKWELGNTATGLIFFGILLALSQILSIPFALYNTFVIEEKFGFNKQTIKGFFVDLFKGLFLGVLLGAPIMALILWIVEQTGQLWWVWAWGALSLFSVLTAWLYPTLLAPLFNKFKPLEEGSLKDNINSLAKKIGFATDGIYVMDASKRSAHGNAYFTGVFGMKRIVLFDTLLADMSAEEVTAVLAHELGHFKLNHIRNSLIRGLLMSLGTFYLMSLVLHQSIFYQAFGVENINTYVGLIIFALWFGMVEFFIQPFETWLSRRNEFAADDFARANLNGAGSMISALKKLREKSFVMPISHPVFSAVYHSHPPMLERLRALSK
jgi:STE24 endopeptidase